MTKRRLIIFGCLLLSAVVGFVGYTVWLAGEFKTITPHFAGTCKKIDGVVGAEDIVIDHVEGIAWLATDDRRAAIAGKPKQGAIWSYDLKQPNAKPVNRTPDPGFSFHPHGLGLHRGKDGVSLMVVNHGSGSGVFDGAPDTVETFAISGSSLKHTGTVKGQLLRSVNDVQPVGEGKFYASIDHGNPTGFTRMLEDYARLPLAKVVYFNGQNVRQVAEGIRYANGVNVSADGLTVYVAGTTDRVIHVFGRDITTGDLWPRERIETGTGVDNIDVDDVGALWIGAHPKLLTFVGHSKDAGKKAPSQVLRVDPGSGEIYEVMMDDGSLLSASSVAARYGNRMLVGPVLDPGFLDCTLP
jgi:arylesterase / paraoxonase